MASEYRNPALTADIIIELEGGIVLIERKNEPLGWAIPGGFVDYGETIEDAARREAMEETRLEVTLLHLLGIYSDPARDPRSHTASVVYVARAEGVPEADDDAASAQIVALDELPSSMCFDHRQILDDYLKFRQTGEIPPPS